MQRCPECHGPAIKLVRHSQGDVGVPEVSPPHRDSRPENAAPWWRGAVIYQIYPRSFLDTDGDGVGDLPGIIRRLDYVAKLGVDAVWIAPFFVSPMADFGYDVADFRDVRSEEHTSELQ